MLILSIFLYRKSCKYFEKNVYFYISPCLGKEPNLVAQLWTDTAYKGRGRVLYLCIHIYGRYTVYSVLYTMTSYIRKRKGKEPLKYQKVSTLRCKNIEL
jgi:hypothetical protein